MEFYEGLLMATSTYIFHGMPQWLAQVDTVIVNEPVTPVVEVPFFVSLLSGVLLAFGFQLLFTNLSMAAGVSYVAHSSNSSTSSSDSSSGGSGIKKIGIAFGVWTLVTVSLALLAACFMAVKILRYADPWTGAIVGLVIWATYFTLLVWFSSTAVGSLVGSVVKSATNGFQTIMGTATAALGAKTASDQVVQTAEAAAAAIRRELSGTLDVSGIQETLQDYIGSLKSAEIDVASVEQEFERLISESDLLKNDGGMLPSVDGQAFEKLLSDRTDLSREEVKRISKRLHGVWEKSTGSSGNSTLNELMAFVATATGGQLATEGLSEQLGKLVKELKRRDGSTSGSSSSDSGDRSGPLQRVAAQTLSSVGGMILGKVDLPEMDANKLLSQINDAQREISGQVSDAAPQSLTEAIPGRDNTIKLDAENYLHHAYIGELKSPQLEDVFRNVLYDSEADATQMREQLAGFGRKTFSDVLSSRGMLTQDEIKNISTRLEIVRQTVLKTVTEVEAVTSEKRIYGYLQSFFKFSPASELSSEMGEDAFRSIFENEPLESSLLRERLKSINADYIRQFLVTRNDVQAHELAEKYAQLAQRVIADAEGVEKAAKVRLQQQQQSIEDYLRNTGRSELSPEGIKRDLKALLNEPDEGISRVRGRVAQFDRNTLVKLLSQRPEFS
ncbi:MAG: hypothetical protein ACFB16_02100, partial [Phormidesmis sp.]